ncbi:MAG: hypothetical protein QHI48_04350 [Bacteroidota bacterium]|nr:hypothetical protein [Bacteroidota bacterium]
MKRSCAPLFLPLFLPLGVSAQTDSAGVAAIPPAAAFVSTSLPREMRDEVWFILRNGAVVSAERSMVSLHDTSLRIRGSLRDLDIRRGDVAGVSSIPTENRFRNAAAGAFLVSAALMFSPQGTPGCYIGSRERSSGIEFPGLSVPAALLAAGMSAAVGLLAAQAEPHSRYIALDGTENDRAWKRILEPEPKPWKLRGTASTVFSTTRDAWQKHHRRFAIDDGRPSEWSAWYADETKMSTVNLAHLFRFGRSVTRSVELGVGVQFEGAQRFYEHCSYMRPGTPPQPVTQVMWNEFRNTAVFAVAQFALLRWARAFSFSAGTGAGVSWTSVDVGGFDASVPEERIVDRTGAAALFFILVEYTIDRELSLGIQADLATAGSVRVPEQVIRDFDQRAYIVIDAFDLPAWSAGVGLTLSYAF